MAWNTIDLTGRKFGRLTATKRLPGGFWICQCECGGESKVLTSNLTRGNSTSCGCGTREANFKHGLSGTHVHSAWRQMLQRCENPKDRAYHNYGGRGIRVSAEWHDFANFFRDMGARPKGYQLDRTDNDRGYEADNCRWVSSKANLNNKRTNRFIEFRGKRQTVAQWADELGLNYRTLNNRINRSWSIERALTEPPNNQ